MAESLPVVSVPGDDGALGGSDDIAPQDIVVLHEVVVEELPVVEGLEGIDTTPFAIVTEPSEPSEPSTGDVIVIGSSEEDEEDEEEEEEEGVGVERVAGGPPRGGMATQAGIHPVTVPSEMPIDDVPPDETMTALPADKETASETRNPSLGKGEDAEDEVKVSNVEVTVVEEVVTTVEVVTVAEEVVTTSTVVTAAEEVVTTVEEVEVVGAMEAEEEKGEKKRRREGEEDAAVKKLKSEEEKTVVEPKKLGPMLFTTPVEMFSYFYNLLHDWNTNLNVNKYEFMVLSELVSQANPQKVGDGIAAFQVRLHPKWQSRCYYLIHKDGSEDDFSYRKCCDALMPLPASLYRANGELDLEKLFPGQKGRHHREQQQQNGGGRGGGRGDHRGGRGGGGRFGGRGGGGRGGRGGGGRRGGRGRW